MAYFLFSWGTNLLQGFYKNKYIKYKKAIFLIF